MLQNLSRMYVILHRCVPSRQQGRSHDPVADRQVVDRQVAGLMQCVPSTQTHQYSTAAVKGQVSESHPLEWDGWMEGLWQH